jgi:hypothetical protein
VKGSQQQRSTPGEGATEGHPPCNQQRDAESHGDVRSDHLDAQVMSESSYDESTEVASPSLNPFGPEVFLVGVVCQIIAAQSERMATAMRKGERRREAHTARW